MSIDARGCRSPPSGEAGFERVVKLTALALFVMRVPTTVPRIQFSQLHCLIYCEESPVSEAGPLGPRMHAMQATWVTGEWVSLANDHFLHDAARGSCLVRQGFVNKRHMGQRREGAEGHERCFERGRHAQVCMR